MNIVGGFGLLFFVISLFSFFRGHILTARMVRERYMTKYEQDTEPEEFWFVYRDLFPIPMK